MKSFTKTHTDIHLVLTEEEANWLKVIMRNLLYSQFTERGDKVDTQMRTKFLEALKGELYENS